MRCDELLVVLLKNNQHISVIKNRNGEENMPEKRPGFIVNFFVRAFVGVCMIFFVNEFLAYQGINVAVGMNLFSFLTSGTLGIPGVALLYGISFYHIL